MPATPTTVSGNAGTATALQTSRNIDGQAFDGTADITVIAPGTHAATSKTTPVDADELPLVDSAASNVLKKLTWANLKATAKTYFDTLYAPIALPGHSQLVYRYTVTGSDKASIDTGVDTPDAGSNDWTAGDLLEIYLYTRTDEAVFVSSLALTVNNDTSSIYDRAALATASGGAPVQATGIAQANWSIGSIGTSATAGAVAAHYMTFPGFSRTDFWKTGVQQGGNASDATAGHYQVVSQVLSYRSTTAISRVAVTPATAAKKLKVGSQLSIYKRLAS